MRWPVVIVIIFVATGCGRIGFDDDGPIRWGPWSPPVRLASINSIYDDWYPTPTRDQLGVYFYSFRPSPRGTPNIWRAQRTTITDSFAPAVEVTEVNSDDDEACPSLSGDGTLLFLSVQDAAQTMPTRLVQWSRPLGAATFSLRTDLGVLAPDLADPHSESDEWISADGLRLLFAGDDSGSSDSHLYESVRTSRDAPFPPGVRLDALDGPGREDSPTLSADGLEIFFVSDRSGGVGMLDVWTSHRAARDQPFDPPSFVAEVSSPDDEYGLRLSDDGTAVYLAYQTDTSGALADIWVATRRPE